MQLHTLRHTQGLLTLTLDPLSVLPRTRSATGLSGSMGRIASTKSMSNLISVAPVGAKEEVFSR